MGAYVLRCDPATAQEAYDNWLTSQSKITRDWRNLQRVKVYSAAAPPAANTNTVLTTRLESHNGLRAIWLIISLVAIIVSDLIMVRWFQQMVVSEFTPQIQGGEIISNIVTAVLVALPGALPFASLFIFRVFAGMVEDNLMASIEDSGIDVQALSKHHDWLWFPGDMAIIAGIQLGLLAFQYVLWFGNVAPLRVYLPILLVIVIFILLYAMAESTKARLSRQPHRHVHSRVQVSTVALRISVAFVLVLGLWWIMLGLLHNAFASWVLSSQSPTRAEPSLIAIAAFDLPKLMSETSYSQLEANILLYMGFLPFSATTVLIMLLPLLYVTREVWLGLSGMSESVLLRPGSGLIPKIGDAEPPFMMRLVIVLTWLGTMWMMVAGAVIALVGIVWMFWGYRDWMPLIMVAPFLWSQGALETLLGATLGRVAVRVMILAIMAPALILVLMWVVAQVAVFKRLLHDLIFNREVSEPVRENIHSLSQAAGMASPMVLPDDSGAVWPDVWAFLPFTRLAVVRVSRHLVEELEVRYLRLVLAHELGHIAMHLRGIWLAQLLSRFSLLGSGYLTLLFDYERYEIEADRFAFQLTGDREGLAELLGKSAELGLRARLKKLQQDGEQLSGNEPKSLRGVAGTKTWQQLTALYRLCYAEGLWGYEHPPLEERLATIRAEKRAISS
jgi:Zn-dependent protease with chaperone function